ncbi:MAG: phage Tail Collar domain protein [Nevskia sp.]|nr:phage Tail Collar domain protein [Nevskia sp.]
MFRIKIKSCSLYPALLAPAVFLGSLQSAHATPFVGQMDYVAFNFPPNGWASCNGALLSISDNDVLFNLIGTTYGGDGVTTFALPDMRGRIPIHQGGGFVIGQLGGNVSRTLIANNLPSHVHAVSLSAPMGGSSGIATSAVPAGHAVANTSRNLTYATTAPNVNLAGPGNPLTPAATVSGTTTGSTGGNIPFSTVPPYLTVNCIISLFGIFPSQN